MGRTIGRHGDPSPAGCDTPRLSDPGLPLGAMQRRQAPLRSATPVLHAGALALRRVTRDPLGFTRALSQAPGPGP